MHGRTINAEAAEGLERRGWLLNVGERHLAGRLEFLQFRRWNIGLFIRTQPSFRLCMRARMRAACVRIKHRDAASLDGGTAGRRAFIRQTEDRYALSRQKDCEGWEGSEIIYRRALGLDRALPLK